jgi:para-aminobenzoate synthetase component I
MLRNENILPNNSAKVQEAIEKMNRWGKSKTPFIFVIDYELKKPIVLTLAEAFEQDIFYKINQNSNFPFDKTPPIEVHLEAEPISFEDYQKSFDIVQKHLHRGDSFLVNLTKQTPIKSNLSLQEIFARSIADYQLYFKGEFVLFSPEIFVKIEHGIMYSHPMKGTIPANVPNAEEEILANPKELAEHTTIVDLIRNDISMVAEKVWVERFRYITKIPTNNGDLLQVSSEICGKMPDNYQEQIGTILFKMLPAGSICGAPKPQTLQIIKEAEGYERGYYTGVFGIFDGENLDSSVMIRFIEKIDNGLVFKSGGGITVNSEVNAEYQELIDKVYLPIPKKKVQLLETMYLKDGVLQNIFYHNQRFNQSRKEVFGQKEALNLEELILIPEGFQAGKYRCRVVYGKNGIEETTFHLYQEKEIKNLKFIDIGDWDYSYKYADRSFLNSLLSDNQEVDEVVMVKNGFITDCTIANLAFWNGTSWFTPSMPLLNGTKRQQLIDKQLIIEKEIKIQDLKNYQSICLINCFRDLDLGNSVILTPKILSVPI